MTGSNFVHLYSQQLLHLASFLSLKKDKSNYLIITAQRIFTPITAPFISLKIPQKATLLIITAPPILLPFIAPCNFLISDNMAGRNIVNYNSPTYNSSNYYTLHLSYL